MLQKTCFISLLLSAAVVVSAQEIDLNKMLEEEQKKEDQKKTNYTEATFKTTRIINGHSIENIAPGIMDFKISHRFGTVNGGVYDLFGLDNASMRMGFDFGITPRFMAGVGRSTFQKQFDGFLKYKILRQSSGYKTMPISMALVTSTMVTTMKISDPSPFYFSNRLQFAHQLLIARKFSEGTSIQITPTLIHYNYVPLATDPNDLLAIGIGGRQKIWPRVSVNAEYYYLVPGYRFEGTSNSFSLGVDLETGGHVFQLHFTNSRGMTERTFITETTGKWSNGDIFFGFNISRVFSLKKKPKS